MARRFPCEGGQDAGGQGVWLVPVQKVPELDAALAEQAKAQLASRGDPKSIATIAKPGAVGRDQADATQVVGMLEFDRRTVVERAGARNPAARLQPVLQHLA